MTWSDELYHIWGVDPQEAVLTKEFVLARVHPDDRAALDALVDRAYREHEPYEFEHRIIRPDGTTRILQSRGAVLLDETGQAVRMFGTGQDVTERREAEETIRQIVEGIAPTTGHDFFRTLANHLSVACEVEFAVIGEIDSDDPNLARTIAVSRRGELVDNFEYDLHGTPCENVIRRSMCYYAANVQREFPRDTLLADLGINSYLGTPLYASTGEAVGLIALLHVRPLAQPERVKAILQVVAARAGAELEREQTQAALRASDERLRDVVEHMPAMVAAVDDFYRIVFWNKECERVTGYSANEIVGSAGWAEVLFPTAQSRRSIVENRSQEKSYDAWEAEISCRDGSKRSIAWSGFSHQMRIPGWRTWGIGIDVTQRKRAEKELAIRQAELLHAARLSTVGRMVAALSHEVAQPLTAIGNFAATCQQLLDHEPSCPTETLRPHVEAIIKQNQRCRAILGRLRDFSRRTAARRSTYNVEQLLRDATELVSNELRCDNVTVRFELPSALPDLLCDRIQLQQVLVNLLTNARDAVRELPADRREITIRASATQDVLVVDVADRGIGVSQEVAHHLFEPFFTTKDHGMGIGLNICQSIIQDHGGQIEAFSNDLGGATLRVRLPLARSGHDG